MPHHAVMGRQVTGRFCGMDASARIQATSQRRSFQRTGPGKNSECCRRPGRAIESVSIHMVLQAGYGPVWPGLLWPGRLWPRPSRLWPQPGRLWPQPADFGRARQIFANFAHPHWLGRFGPWLGRFFGGQADFGQRPPPDRPPPDRPKFRAFFSFSHSMFIFFLSCLFSSLSGGLLVEFWWCFGRSGPQMCLFSPSGCPVKPRRPAGRRGLPHEGENKHI